jgi:hypothetical protein
MDIKYVVMILVSGGGQILSGAMVTSANTIINSIENSAKTDFFTDHRYGVGYITPHRVLSH